MANISKYLKTLIDSLASIAISGNYNDLSNKPTLGTASDKDVGTGANQILQLDEYGKIPNVDGSNISNIPYSGLDGKPVLGSAASKDVGTGANQILQLDEYGKIPNVDGSNLTNVLASGTSPFTVYSVNSAKVNASGYANFINKVDNTEISFDTDSGSTPIKIVYPNGNLENNISLNNITGISADGAYYIIKESGSNPYVTTLQPIESIDEPSSPATNQLWLDLSTKPYIPKKYNGSSWDIVQFIKLGEAIKSSGILGTPISYVKWENKIISNTLSNPFVQNISHNIGTAELIVQYSLVLLSAAAGYSAGEEIKRWIDGYTGVSDTAMAISFDKNTFNIAKNVSNIAIANKTTGSGTVISSYSLKVKINLIRSF